MGNWIDRQILEHMFKIWTFLFWNGNCRQNDCAHWINLKIRPLLFLLIYFFHFIWFNSDKYFSFHLLIFSLWCHNFSSIFFLSADFFFSFLTIFLPLQNKCSLWSFDFKQKMNIFFPPCFKRNFCIFFVTWIWAYIRRLSRYCIYHVKIQRTYLTFMKKKKAKKNNPL